MPWIQFAFRIIMTLSNIFEHETDCEYVVIEYSQDKPGLVFGILKAKTCQEMNTDRLVKTTMDGFSSSGYVRFTGSHSECSEKFSELCFQKFKEPQSVHPFFKRKTNLLQTKSKNKIASSVMENFEKMYGMSVSEWIKKGQPKK